MRKKPAASRSGSESSSPHEQRLNPYLDLAHTFKHFYVRKVCFVKPSEGFVVFRAASARSTRLFEVAHADPDREDRRFPVVLIGAEPLGRARSTG